MIVVRVGRVVAVVACILAWASCGDVFRPIAIPITPTQPTPSSLHYALTLSSNGVCPPQQSQPCGPGSSARIDVSGDSQVGTAQVGLEPVHAVVLPGDNEVYVADQMEDTVSFYAPSSVAPVSTISLPAGAAPAFVAATQSDTVYVANSGNGTVGAIPTANNVVTDFIPVGVKPVALAETPDGKKLYVANQGSGTVTSINTLDKSVSRTITTGSSPVWAAARSDSARVYVLNSGSGSISSLDTSPDALLASVPVTAGANFMLYDKTLNRLYVTNPSTTVMQSFDVSADPPAALPSVDLAAGASASCPSGCSPAAVAALPDGSRIYVASYHIAPNCTEPADSNPAGCITVRVTVINASNFSIAKTIPVTLPDTAVNPPGTKPDTPVLAVCTAARFRLFAAASSDSTRVYVSYCDAGATAVIRTTADTSPGTQSGADFLVGDLPAPASALSPVGSSTQPPPQNPMFVLSGP